MIATATLSTCHRYRYTLSREWDENLPRVLWIMLNPSTADAWVDDPTIRRVRGFTERLGCGGFTVVNLFAYRATDPSDLRIISDPIGPENDAHIADQASRAAISGSKVIAAWGNLSRPGKNRAMDLLKGSLMNATLHHLGELTKEGQPRHPLYLPAHSTLHCFGGSR